MTPDELRAKHHVGQNEAENQCQACYSADGYPCDVIKVLDDCEGLVNHFEEHYGMVYCFTCEKEL